MRIAIKIMVLAVVLIVVAILAMVCYRLFFMFDRKKVSDYTIAAANTTGDPNTACKLIVESTEAILKSQDLTKSVLLLAQVDKIDKEKALVLTALNQCYALGFIERPKPVEPAKNPDQTTVTN